MRSMVVNGDVALRNLGPTPFGVEILRVRLRRTLRMTPLGVGGTKKRDWREDESSGKLHTSLRPWTREMRFPGAEPRPSAPQAQVPNFLH